MKTGMFTTGYWGVFISNNDWLSTYQHVCRRSPSLFCVSSTWATRDHQTDREDRELYRFLCYVWKQAKTQQCTGKTRQCTSSQIYSVARRTFFSSCTPRMEWSHNSTCQRFQSEVCKAKVKAVAVINQVEIQLKCQRNTNPLVIIEEKALHNKYVELSLRIWPVG